MNNEDKTPVEAASESSAGLGGDPSLNNLSLRVFKAREYFGFLGMKNTNGLTKEERVANHQEYYRAKAELAKAERELEHAVNNYA